MIIKFIHDDKVGIDIKNYLLSISDKFEELIIFNEDCYKEKKKAVQVKSSCGTKMIPFCAIYTKDDIGEKHLINAFYTEVKQCTLENIKNYLNARNY